MLENMLKTPLHEIHKELGARMVDFAGWKLPLQFEGIRREHMAVRRACGVFDVSHMGEVEVEGPDAEALCQKLNTNDVAKLGDGRARYGFFCYEDGGTVDDLITYRLSRERFLLCVNASNTEKVLGWIRENAAGTDADVRDASSRYAQIAVQGPACVAVMEAALPGAGVGDMPRFSFAAVSSGGFEAVAARTGYTGEDGFEVFLPPAAAEGFWKKACGGGGVPCGLGARDTLRIEAGYPLYGHEIDESTTPVEAGLGRYVKTDKGDFVGRAALVSQVERGPARELVGFRMLERGVARRGHAVAENGRRIGEVTSGTMSPVLGTGVGMALVSRGHAARGGEVKIEIRGRERRAAVCGFPLHKT